MKSEYRAVVIGGGITGAAIVCHRARAGWSDIALIERRELTAGSGRMASGANPGSAGVTELSSASMRSAGNARSP